MTASAKKPARAGQTSKISISLGRVELAVLRQRARRLHAGNLSAAVAEGIVRLQEEEGRTALVSWLGEAGQASTTQRAALRAEWAPSKASRRPR